MPRLDDTRLAAEQYASTAALEVRASVWVPDPSAETVQDIAIAALADATAVLEVGCGMGALTRRLPSHGIQPVAVDRSPMMAAATRASCGATTLAADLRALPFGDARFEAVLAGWVLFHLDDVATGLAELRRVLRSGGLLVAITNGDEHLRELWALVGNPLEPFTFSRENGREQLETSGFSVVDQRDTTATAVFPDRRAAHEYVATVSPEHADLLPPLPKGLKATGQPTVFIARAA